MADGDRYRYVWDQGLGENARIGDPDLDDDLPSDMRALDMPSGCEVTVDGHDRERHLVIVAWVDGNGTDRRTTIEPGHFQAAFERVVT